MNHIWKTGTVRGTPEYNSWQQMRLRCLSPKSRDYRNYGGRGITVCKRWAKSFDAFLADMGARPEGTSLGRIDNDGNYIPSNCRWETPCDQHRNTRLTTWIEANGERLPRPVWAERLGISSQALAYRIKAWGDPVRAVTTPKTEPKL